MKLILLATALTLGTAAVAQTTQDDQTNQPSGQTVDDPAQSSGPEGVTQQGTDPDGTGQAPTGTNQGNADQGNMSQGNSTQGNMSQSSTTQGNMSGGNMSGGSMSGGSMSGSMGNMSGMSGQAMSNYPPCSRTVTDRCVQTYERGVRRARR